MPTIPGASQFINAATLANRQGLAAQAPTVLDNTGADLLNTGRRLSGGLGVGISANARALNQNFLNRTTDINALLSLAAGSDATPEGVAQEILALRSRLPQSSLAADLRDNGNVPPSENGQEVDTQA